MKLYGSLTEVTSLVFREDTQAVTFRPNQSTTYTTSRDIQLPPGDAAHVLVSADSTQTLTNKTLGITNTVTLVDTLFTLQDDGDNTKQVQFQLSGITTGTTRTFTFPDLSGTLITTATAVDLTSVQTLQNKTLDNTNTVTLKDTLFTLQDDGDTSKQLRLQLSGLTTATTRTLTVPDADDTIAVLAAAQTLTNKTISGASNTLSSISDTSLNTISTAGKVSGTAITSGNISTSGSFTTTNSNGFKVDSTVDAQLITDSSDTFIDSSSTLKFRTNGLAGTLALTLDASQIATFSGAILTSSGSATAPAVAFSADADGTGTGMYRDSANVIGLAANGVANLLISNGGLHYMNTPAGNSTSPAITAQNDTNTGIYHDADIFGIAAAGNAGLEVRSAGVIFNTTGTAPAGAVDIYGNDTAPGSSTVFSVRASDGTLMFFNGNVNGITSDVTASTAVLKVNKDSVNGESIRASGTVVAPGGDYAEYMKKDVTTDTISKAEVCGVKSNGLLTKKWSEAITFIVKSTDPSFIGGDGWRSGILTPEENEAERVKWDRIAFSGQVPCLMTGVYSAGDWVVPQEGPGDSIVAVAVSDSSITFAQYKQAVGQIWKDLGDGRALVAVGVK